jgi:hypothetical protein
VAVVVVRLILVVVVLVAQELPLGLQLLLV